MLRAIIVDDEELSVKRLMKILTESGDFEACYTFLNPWEAYEFVKANSIHIAFLDISMPEINGIGLSGLLLDLDASIDVVFITAYDDYAVQAFDLSALDYLMKPITTERMSKTLNKIRKKRQGDGGDSPVSTIQPVANPLVETLTSREVEIMYTVLEGLSNNEIAVRFGITEATVKSHVFRIYGKLGVKRRSQAIAKARELKLLE